ncbi:MAG: hypothetical protein V4489_09420 [Chlamydiota bacterium]
MNQKLLTTIFAITVIYTIPGQCAPPPPAPFVENPPPSTIKALPSQALADALHKIGGKANDIGQIEKSGIPSSDLIAVLNTYAGDSGSSKFKSLLSSERDALVFFSFKLQTSGDLSDDNLHSLMVAEKLRTEMTKSEINELMSLFNEIKSNPEYVLSHEDVRILNVTAPFISYDPYSFADVLGTLIEPILHATPESIGVPASTELILINAAKTLTRLPQYKLDNLQNIADKYQGSEKFIPTADNIDDVTDLMETAYYPNSAHLLLPFLGADALIALSKIPNAYPDSFKEDTVNQYIQEVVLNPAVETYYKAGAYPRYNPNWTNNRAQNRGDRAGTQARGKNENK